MQGLPWARSFCKLSSISFLTQLENVAHANICAEQALCSNAAYVAGKPFFVTNAQPIETWEFMSCMMEAMGCQRPRINLPAKMLLFASQFSNMVYHRLGLQMSSSPLLNPDTVYFLSCTRTFNTSKARKLLGYDPIVSLEDGIMRTAGSISQLPDNFDLSRKEGPSGSSKADKLLGGGIAADILLWRDEKKTFSYITLVFLLFYWFLLSDRTFVSSSAKILLVISLALYIHGVLPSKVAVAATESKLLRRATARAATAPLLVGRRSRLPSSPACSGSSSSMNCSSDGRSKHPPHLCPAQAEEIDTPVLVQALRGEPGRRPGQDGSHDPDRERSGVIRFFLTRYCMCLVAMDRWELLELAAGKVIFAYSFYQFTVMIMKPQFTRLSLLSCSCVNSLHNKRRRDGGIVSATPTLPLEHATADGMVRHRDLGIGSCSALSRLQLNEVEKTVFVVYFSGEQTRAIILRICASFGASCYPVPEDVLVV